MDLLEVRVMEPVYVCFRDHQERDYDAASGLTCEVMGWLIGEDESYLHICTWLSDGEPQEDSLIFDILKSTVIRRHDLPLEQS